MARTGTYVAHIDGTDAFVINGFYPSMRDVFLRAASGVSWKLVGWSAVRSFAERLLPVSDRHATHRVCSWLSACIGLNNCRHVFAPRPHVVSRGSSSARALSARQTL